MQKHFFLVPVLLSVLVFGSFGSAFGETGANFINQFLGLDSNGNKVSEIAIKPSSPQRIFDGFNYQDYLFSNLANVLRVETMSSSIELDKNSCEFNVYPGGFVSGSPYLVDDIKPYQKVDGTSTWNHLNSIDTATCQASWNGSELIAQKQVNGTGTVQYVYILQNGIWKTELRVHNDSGLNNRHFGFDQVFKINQDTINFGGSQRDLDNFSGQTFGRTWLENNEGKVIDLLNRKKFNFDIAFDSLESVSVLDTGVNSSELVFSYTHNTSILPNNATLILDPVLEDVYDNAHGARDSSFNGNCNDSKTNYSLTTQAISQRYTATYDCDMIAFQIGTTGIPVGSVIQKVELEFDVDTVSGTATCDITPMTVDITTATDAQIFDDIKDGTEYVDNNTVECASTGTKTLDLGASAVTDLQTAFDAGNPFGIGFKLNDPLTTGMVRLGTGGAGTPDPTFHITYIQVENVPNPPTATSANKINATAGNVWWDPSDYDGLNNDASLIQEYHILSMDQSGGHPYFLEPLPDNNGQDYNYSEGFPGAIDMNGNELLYHFESLSDGVIPGGLTDGLVHFFRMEESSGAVGDDCASTGSGDCGTSITSTTHSSLSYSVTGVVGDAIKGNTDPQLKSTTLTNFIDDDNTWTIAFYTDDAGSGNTQHIFDTRSSVGGQGVNIQLDSAEGLNVQISDGTNLIHCETASSAVHATDPQTIIITHDASSDDCTAMEFYVEGSSIALSDYSSGTVGDSSELEFNLFTRTDDATNKDFIGELDELAFWNRVLTSDEKSQYHNSGSGVDLTTVTNTGIRDYSGNGINATIGGSVGATITDECIIWDELNRATDLGTGACSNDLQATSTLSAWDGGGKSQQTFTSANLPIDISWTTSDADSSYWTICGLVPDSWTPNNSGDGMTDEDENVLLYWNRVNQYEGWIDATPEQPAWNSPANNDVQRTVIETDGTVKHYENDVLLHTYVDDTLELDETWAVACSIWSSSDSVDDMKVDYTPLGGSTTIVNATINNGLEIEASYLNFTDANNDIKGTNNFILSSFYEIKETIDGFGTFLSFDSTNDFEVRLGTSTVSIHSGGTQIKSETVNHNINSTNHLIIMRVGNDFSIFNNGTEIGTATTNSINLGNPTNDIYHIGSVPELNTNFLNATLDEFFIGNSTLVTTIDAGLEDDVYARGDSTTYQWTYKAQPGNVTTGTVTAIPTNTSQWIRVLADNDIFNSTRGGIAELSMTGVAGVENLTATTPPATTGWSQIDLEWDLDTDGFGVNGYKIEYESPVGGGWSDLVANTTNTLQYYNHTGLSINTQYNYRVTGLNGTDSGTTSNTDSATTLYPIYNPVTVLNDSAVRSDEVDISWTLPSANDGAVFLNYMINTTTPHGVADTYYGNITSSGITSTTITGLSVLTPYSIQMAVYSTHGTVNWNGKILNITTLDFDPPGTPTLGATALSDTSLRFTSVAGTAGHNATIWYGLQCELNSAGSWSTVVSNASLPGDRIHEVTGLNVGDVYVCQWRDGSVDGWSGWSNNATDILQLSVIQSQRSAVTSPDDKLIAFDDFLSEQGGLFFGLTLFPFATMLVGFMAGKKTVRIFTLIVLALMGIFHASGYFVYPDWYWSMCLLLGLGLILGRQKSD